MWARFFLLLVMSMGLIWACDDDPSSPGFGQIPDIGSPPDSAIRDANTDFRQVGQPCTENNQCESGFCVLIRGMERVCTRKCNNNEECPEDWICRQVTNTGVDVTFICVPEDAPCAGADLMTNAEHCGECEHACEYPGALGECLEGACQMDACKPGFFNLDEDPETGCEYACTVTIGGTERCDTIDNDCDGTIDEGIDLLNDLENCGACGAACDPPNADGICTAGTCHIVSCVEGFVDQDGNPENGCEVGCRQSNEGQEACDRVDNDCDGELDEGFDLQNDPAHCGACHTGCDRANAETACREGECTLIACRPDFFDRNNDPEDGCEIGCTRSNGGSEACDVVDNDCDGIIDEGIDTQNDPEHCGGCGQRCQLPNALTTCQIGACQLVGCLDNFFDRNLDPTDGCEVGCEPSNDGVEACDAVDNDCDGMIDEGVNLHVDPANCGACGIRCDRPNAITACQAAECSLLQCTPDFFDRNNDPEDGCEVGCVRSNGGIEACDGIDNDCDAQIDEDADTMADPLNCGACGVRCDRSNAVTACQVGQCVLLECDPDFYDRNDDPTDGCEVGCQQSNGGIEACDGVDNDCDAATDEGFNLANDVHNCGVCGLSCDRLNAVSACFDRACALTGCDPGFVDLDQQSINGCEYACVPANGGTEICNTLDDDCDGRFDEDFDLTADINNCGLCGRACDFPNAAAICDAGQCTLGDCALGFVDADNNPQNGCELACVPSNGGVEICDDQDNDCDGLSDEGFDTQRDVDHCGGCGQACAPQNAEAVCIAGACRVAACDDIFVDANDDPTDGCECRPFGAEGCNGSDDDCDGLIDETFDLQNDPNHCGGCGFDCVRAQAETICQGGACQILGCDDGFVDVDGDPQNGCEVECAQNPDIPECGGGINIFDGRFDIVPNVHYGCGFLGIEIVTIDVPEVIMAVGGNTLIVNGAPTAMNEAPAPVGVDFRVQGVIAGGCTETYILDASFTDDDTFEGTFEIRFAGGDCAVTDCANQSFPIQGVRIP